MECKGIAAAIGRRFPIPTTPETFVVAAAISRFSES